MFGTEIYRLCPSPLFGEPVVLHPGFPWFRHVRGFLSHSLIGSLVKGFCAEFCGNSAELLWKLAQMRFVALRKRAEILQRLRNICGNSVEMFLQ